MRDISDRYKQFKNVTIYDGVSIGDNVQISEGSIIYPNVTIGSNTFVGPYCILGEPSVEFYSDMRRFNKAMKLEAIPAVQRST